MAIQSSGQIKLSEIASEFSDSAPYSMSEFYRGGGKVADVALNNNVPTSGQIKFSNMYGATTYTSGSQSYTSAGTYSLTVPAGVSTMTVSVYAGGGGGSASWFCGDGFPGGGGGSGGYQTNQSLSVTPGETLSIVVGAYGAGRGFVNCGGNPAGYTGGTSSVTSGSGSVSATGGSGGTSGQPGGGGAGGSPNGVNGGSGYGTYYGGAGGNNGTGYGSGGRGGNVIAGQLSGVSGTQGAVFVSW